jgi:hypothetical protein
MKLTRRQLSAAALASLAALAQTPAPPGQGATSPVALTGEAELQAAKDELKATVEMLSQIEVPMTTEPAFVFQP